MGYAHKLVSVISPELINGLCIRNRAINQTDKIPCCARVYILMDKIPLSFGGYTVKLPKFLSGQLLNWSKGNRIYIFLS
jgi:hypothetical protein